jgi:3-oxoadipate enol-lactonase
MTPTFADVKGVRLHYRLEGKAGGPPVVLCHGLLASHALWTAQMPALTRDYRVLRFDNRGHGASGVTPAPYSVAQLADDALALMDALEIARAHFVGSSLGGMIGQEIAAHHPSRLASLVLVGSRSVMGPRSFWDERIRSARAQGVAPFVPTMLDRWFTPAFRASHPATVEAIAQTIVTTPLDGFVGACMAIREMDHTQLLARITTPTLVMSGDQDPGVPVEDTRRIQASIPGAEAMVVEGARHLFSIERRETFDALLLEWLARH